MLLSASRLDRETVRQVCDGKEIIARDVFRCNNYSAVDWVSYLPKGIPERRTCVFSPVPVDFLTRERFAAPHVPTRARHPGRRRRGATRYIGLGGARGRPLSATAGRALTCPKNRRTGLHSLICGYWLYAPPRHFTRHDSRIYTAATAAAATAAVAGLLITRATPSAILKPSYTPDGEMNETHTHTHTYRPVL